MLEAARSARRVHLPVLQPQLLQPQTGWQLRSVSALEKGHTPWARFGHEFLRDDRVLGAVETIGDGRVWMHPDLTPVEEDEVALMSTALLYYGSLLELRDT